MKNKSNKNIKFKNNPWKPISIYLIFGFSWVYFFNNVLEKIVMNQLRYKQIQAGKGMFYVFLTATVLYLIIKYNIEQLNILAYIDDLTKLKNKTLFEKDIRRMIAKKIEFTIYLVDVDRFKYLNEIHGHDYGDVFLIMLGNELEALEKYNVYRLYGDRFLIVEKGNDLNNIMQTITALKGISHKKYELKDIIFNPSINIGVTRFPNDATNFKKINQNLDMALNKAKEKGDFQLYNDNLLDEIVYFNEIQQKLKIAVEDNKFTLFCQPIYNMNNNEIVSYEILLRWIENDKYSDIEKVIQAAEKTKQIQNIDCWVIDRIFKLIYLNPSLQNKEFSINISSSFFSSNQLQDYLIKKSKEYNIDSTKITLEITEHSVIRDLERTKKIMNELIDQGFKMSLDDFGTKYSSLNYISKLPFDVLKIDKSYIDNILDNDRDLAIVELIIQLAKKMNLSIVSEGIESKEQYDKLNELGSEKGQGYYMARPMPIEEII